MNLDDIKMLYKYHDWANQRILMGCARLTTEQFTAPSNIGIGHSSLRTTLVHMLDAQYQWRLTCLGYYAELLPPEAYETMDLRPEDYPTLEVLEEHWQTEEQEMDAYLALLTDDMLHSTLRYTIANGTVRERTLWHCLYHVVNHAMQHRSEIAVLLTDFGQSPGDLDFTLFLNEYYDLPD